MYRQGVSSLRLVLIFVLTCFSLSYLEMRLTWCHLLWRFDLVNADDPWQWDEKDNFKHMRAYSTWQKPGLAVRAYRRKQ